MTRFRFSRVVLNFHPGSEDDHGSIFSKLPAALNPNENLNPCYDTSVDR